MRRFLVNEHAGVEKRGLSYVASVHHESPWISNCHALHFLRYLFSDVTVHTARVARALSRRDKLRPRTGGEIAPGGAVHFVADPPVCNVRRVVFRRSTTAVVHNGNSRNLRS